MEKMESITNITVLGAYTKNVIAVLQFILFMIFDTHTCVECIIVILCHYHLLFPPDVCFLLSSKSESLRG